MDYLMSMSQFDGGYISIELTSWTRQRIANVSAVAELKVGNYLIYGIKGAFSESWDISHYIYLYRRYILKHGRYIHQQCHYSKKAKSKIYSTEISVQSDMPGRLIDININLKHTHSSFYPQAYINQSHRKKLINTLHVLARLPRTHFTHHSLLSKWKSTSYRLRWYLQMI